MRPGCAAALSVSPEVKSGVPIHLNISGNRQGKARIKILKARTNTGVYKHTNTSFLSGFPDDSTAVKDVGLY